MSYIYLVFLPLLSKGTLGAPSAFALALHKYSDLTTNYHTLSGIMGQGVSKIVECEKTSWIKPHKLEYSQKLRDTQLALIDKFGRNLKLCHIERDYNGWGLLKYQHWFVTDGTWRLNLEVGKLKTPMYRFTVIDFQQDIS